MDAGPRADRRSSSIRRVGSPSAANNSAALARLFSTLRFDILLNPDNHFGPSLAVVLDDLGPAGERDFVEAGLQHAQPCTASGRLQRERDGGPRLARVVDAGIDGARVPLPDEAVRRRHLRYFHQESRSFVPRILRRHPDLGAGRDVAFDADAEPRGQILRGGQCAPDTFGRRVDVDRSFNLSQIVNHHYATSRLHNTQSASAAQPRCKRLTCGAGRSPVAEAGDTPVRSRERIHYAVRVEPCNCSLSGVRLWTRPTSRS